MNEQQGSTRCEGLPWLRQGPHWEEAPWVHMPDQSIQSNMALFPLRNVETARFSDNVCSELLPPRLPWFPLPEALPESAGENQVTF